MVRQRKVGYYYPQINSQYIKVYVLTISGIRVIVETRLLLRCQRTAWSLWLPWSMATHGRDTSYLWQWLPISVDSGYLYFVTVATHIGYLFLLRSNIPQESFASTVSLYDGNAVIALHDKSGRLSDPTRPCSFAMTFNSTAERKDTLSHRPLKLIIPRLMSQTSSAAMARSQERISHSLNFLIDDKFLPFVIWHPVPV